MDCYRSRLTNPPFSYDSHAHSPPPNFAFQARNTLRTRKEPPILDRQPRKNFRDQFILETQNSESGTFGPAFHCSYLADQQILDKMAAKSGRFRQNLRRIDIYILFGSAISLILVLVNDPWWTLQGTANNNLFQVQVSPYYLKTFATGIAGTVPFAGPLGLATRIILAIGFVSLALASIRPNAWYHDLAFYLGLSALAELFLSFMLMLHAAETTFLGAFGSIPPFSGTSQPSESVIGLDLTSYVHPLVTAGFGLPLYLGLVSCGLVVSSLVTRSRRKKNMKGISAIFSPAEAN